MRRFQIDYILVKKRYRNSILDARTYPGADVNSDHNLVAAKIRIKLKKIFTAKRKSRWNREKVKGPEGHLFKEDIEVQIKSFTAEEEERSVESRWKRLKEAIHESAGQRFGKQMKRKKKKPWITQQMLDKMDERRKWKNGVTNEAKVKYKQLNNELRRETDGARERWWQNECEELEALERNGRLDLVYDRVRNLCKVKKGSATQKGILSETGVLLTEQEDIKKRWVEYIEMLYGREDKPDEINLEKRAILKRVASDHQY